MSTMQKNVIMNKKPNNIRPNKPINNKAPLKQSNKFTKNTTSKTNKEKNKEN